MKIRVLTTMTVVALLLTTAVAGAQTSALDDEQLTSALLTPEQMPDGPWTTAAADVIETEPRTRDSATEGGWCGGPTDGYTADQLAQAGPATTTFQQVVEPDAPYWFVTETLRSFEPSASRTAAGEAKSFVATVRAAASACETWVTGGELPNTVTFEEVPLPGVGGRLLAYRITASTEDFSADQYVVYVRLANNVVVVHSRIEPPDDVLLARIARRAVKGLRQAVAANR